MATVASSLSFKASLAWQQTEAVSGTNSGSQTDTGSFTVSPDASVLTQVLVGYGTIAAAANTTVDFYSITTALNKAKTITKLRGWLIKATGATGQLKIEPGASDALAWALAGTTPSLTFDCGTEGCCFAFYNGASFTVSNTAKNLKLSNPGSATITYYLYALVGE